MGYGVMAYAVRLEQIAGCVGARDPLLLSALLEDFRAARAIDELLAGATDGDGEPPTARDVLRHLVMDEPSKPGIGFAYGYCFKHICERYGEFLDNAAWYPIGFDFVEEVQAELARQGVTDDALSVADLVWGGAPVPLPPIDDFPGIGHLPRARIPAALATLAAVDLAKAADPEVRAGLTELSGWLTECAHTDRDLICFYH
jgi:hypothetical protein